MTRLDEATRRRQGWWALCAAALLLCVAAGLWQASAIVQFRRPSVDQMARIGESVLFDGVRYELRELRHAPELPLTSSLRDIRDSDVVTALDGAELVLVVLTVEIEDPAREPETVFCDVTLRDAGGRSWRTDGTVDYLVQQPEAVTCTGPLEGEPEVGVPFDVGKVFQVPADVAGEVTVRVRLSGGTGRQLLELRPQ